MGELTVGESEALGTTPRPLRHRVESDRRQLRTLLHDHRHLVEEPRVDPCRLVDRVDGDPTVEQFADLLDAVGGRDRCPGEQFLVGQLVEMRRGGVTTEPESALLQRPQRLLEALRKGSTDGHDLADGLHLRAEHAGGSGELLERPARNLGDDVVDHRLEARRRGPLRGLGDVVGDLVEGVADGEPGGDLGDREPGRLRGEGRRSRDPRVHLDDDLTARARFDGELHVRAAGLDADAPDAGERRVAHLLVLDVGEGLDRGHGDRVTRVDAHRIDVLDAADDHAVVGVVTHHLELVLLPAVHRFLDEDLADRARLEPVGRHALELLGRGGDSGSTSAEDVRRPDDRRQSDVGDDDAGLLDRVSGARPQTVESDADHRLLELLAVLGGGDRLGIGTDHLGRARHADQAPFEELHGDVQAGLAAERRQDGVGTLTVDDRRDDLPRERLDVRRVGEVGVGHDRRRVRVGEDDPIALLAQHAAGLGAGVVELAGLADDDRAGSDDQDRVDVGALGHQRLPAVTPARRIMSANWSKR